MIKGVKTLPMVSKIRILNFISHKMPVSINVSEQFLKHCNFHEMVTSKEAKIRDLALSYCEKILQFNPNITFSSLFKDSLEARDLFH